MDATKLAMTVLAMVLANNSAIITAVQLNASTDTTTPQQTSQEFQDRSPKSIHVQYPEVQTTSQKSSSDDFKTFSSLTSDVTVDTSSSSSKNSKGPSNFVTRGRTVKNPFYYSKDDQEMEFEDDSHSDSFFNSGFPKWNRFNTNHRQLNKYSPTPIEADIMSDEDGSAGYGSSFDFNGGGGSNYETMNYRWSEGDGMGGWYNDPISQSSRPVPIIAEIRKPEHQKMSVDLSKIGLLALIKVALAKLKILGIIKAKLFLLFKLKLLMLIMTIKFIMLAKFLKIALSLPLLFSLYTIPLMLSRLSRLNMLLTTPVLVPNTTASGGNTANGGTVSVGRINERARLDPLVILDTGMRSETCMERVSCWMAGADQPSLTFIGLNWVMSPILKYIPNEKIRTFISTFTNITNYRLDNLYSNALPSSWTKWCNDHYACT